MENSKLRNTRKKIAWLEILAMFMCVATKHSNFDIHISLEIYYVSIRIYSLGCFGEVREGYVGFKILIMGFSTNW